MRVDPHAGLDVALARIAALEQRVADLEAKLLRLLSQPKGKGQR